MGSFANMWKNFDKRLNHDELDEFQSHLNAALRRRIKSLEEEERNLTPDQFEYPDDIDRYRDHLSELFQSALDARELGYELSIIALYKKVEGHVGRFLHKRLPSAAGKNLSYFAQLCAALPFDIKTVEGFAGFNELRLLNNAIKHGGVVSDELAKNFPSWKEGEKLTGLDEAFDRLLPEVKRYVADLVEKVYAAAP